MKVIQDTQAYGVLRLEKGERFPDALQPWLLGKNIQGAFFYGLGGATQLSVSYYDLAEKTYVEKEFSGDYFEILQVSGNVAKLEDTVALHSHISFSGSTLEAKGGHLHWLIVGGTLELYIHVTAPLVRIHDEELGLALLQEQGIKNE